MGNCASCNECCVRFCSMHGDYPLKIRHGNKVGLAETEHIRRTSKASISATSADSNRSQSRRNSMRSWYSDNSGSGAVLNTPGREGRRVSIASDDCVEWMIYDAEKAPNTCTKSGTIYQ